MASFERKDAVPLLPELEADLALLRRDPLPDLSSERVLARLNQAMLEPEQAALAKVPERRRVWRAPHVLLFAASFSMLAAAAVMIGRGSTPVTPPAANSGARAPEARTNVVVPPMPEAMPRSAEAPGLPRLADSVALPRPTKPPPSQAASAQSALLTRELLQLGQIRQALAQSPATALSLADAGHREFKGGVMHEEREALAVLALAKLGARPAFEARARRFLKVYPKSGFRERIAALLGPSSAQPSP